MFTTKKLTYSPAKAGEFRLEAENNTAREAFARKLAAPTITKAARSGRGMRARKSVTKSASVTPNQRVWNPRADAQVRVTTPLIPVAGISFTGRDGRSLRGAAAESVARKVLSTLR